MAEMKDKRTQSEELWDAQLDEVDGGFQSEKHGSYLKLDGIKGESIDSERKDRAKSKRP